MATVYIGGASIDENGKSHGGQAGNQTGRELKRQKYYVHPKGWRVFRARSAEVAKRIATAMAAAVANRHIGYDQYQRNTLYREASKVGFDPSKVAVDCETDCSALVRVCCAYAGILGLPEGFRTTNEPKNLLATGAFTELVGERYTKVSTYLKAGDILCTATQGHTVVVLNDGPKAGSTVTEAEGLHRGDYGTAVTAMQKLLLRWDPACLPKCGADGDFGGETEGALMAFQAFAGLPVTGVYDEATRAKLTGAPVVQQFVEITGGTVNLRTAPGTATGRKMGIARKGDRLPWQGESRDVSGTPWHLVEYQGQNAWISGKFSKVVA